MKTIAQTDNGTAAKTAMPLINDCRVTGESEPTTKHDLAFLVYEAEVEPPTLAPPIKDEAYYVSSIKTAWNKAFESVLEVGRLLNAAAEILQPKRFRGAFVKKLPFSYSVARRLMNLAKSPRINDPKYRRLFPVSWNTLNEIMNLPEEAFQRALRNRQIHPGCQWKDINRIRREYDLAKQMDAKVTVTEASPKSEDASSYRVEHVESHPDDELKANWGEEQDSADPEAMKEVMEKTVAAHVSGAKSLRQGVLNRNKRSSERPTAPKPLYLWIAADLQKAHRDELATLVEELNRRLPQRYGFISEVRMGVPK